MLSRGNAFPCPFNFIKQEDKVLKRANLADGQSMLIILFFDPRTITEPWLLHLTEIVCPRTGLRSPPLNFTEIFTTIIKIQLVGVGWKTLLTVFKKMYEKI